MKGNINTITSEKLQIESDLQQRIKLEEEKENLKNYNERTQKEVQVWFFMFLCLSFT